MMTGEDRKIKTINIVVRCIQQYKDYGFLRETRLRILINSMHFMNLKVGRTNSVSTFGLSTMELTVKSLV